MELTIILTIGQNNKETFELIIFSVLRPKLPQRHLVPSCLNYYSKYIIDGLNLFFQITCPGGELVRALC